MFIEALIFAVIIGYLVKGNINNLENVDIKGLFLPFIAFTIEFIIVMGIKKGLLVRGNLTYCLDLIMYILILIFILKNRKDKFIVLMGIGFLLNAITIFLNGGAMPVSIEALRITGITENIASEGLYILVDENTKFWFLGDVIPLTFLRNFVISIGDIIAVIGLMLFTITGMKKNSN